MIVILGMYGTYCLGFGASKIFIFNVKSMSIIMIFYVQTSFMIIIYVSVPFSLLSIIIISHILYASIIIIIDVNLVIFHNGEWIILGANTINKNSILMPHCRRYTVSHKRATIVASLLWITFVDKIRGGIVSRQCWSGPSRCAIGFLHPWTPGRIEITCHRPFAYVIIF